MAGKIRQLPDFESKMSIEATVKDVDVKTGIVTGYFAAFNNVDSHYDKIMPGAFRKTIAERGPSGSNQIKHLLEHDLEKPLGAIITLREDANGLYFESQFTTGVKRVDDTLRFYDAGVYKEHSIGYRTIKYNFVENPDDPEDFYFELTEIKLWEGSTVLWAANDKTPFTGFKSAFKTREEALDSIDKKMEKVMSAIKVGGLSDETYSSLEIELAKIKSLYRQIDSLVTPAPLSPSTQAEALKKEEDDTKGIKTNQFYSNLKF